jgi:hypothetical protein
MFLQDGEALLAVSVEWVVNTIHLLHLLYRKDEYYNSERDQKHSFEAMWQQRQSWVSSTLTP